MQVIGDKYDFKQLESPKDSTIGYCKGIEVGLDRANESEPFCGIVIVSDYPQTQEFMVVCPVLSHTILEVLNLPRESRRRNDRDFGACYCSKQQTSFRGETTVMKFIGG